MPQEKPQTSFEPLQAMDRQFLAMEDENAHMHVTGFTLYELEPLRSEAGGVDFPAFRQAIVAALDRIPIYRKKLAYTPIERHPVWVDDSEFNLDFHLRRVSLPPPGSRDQLAELASWLVGQPLDHARPLWEMWLIEGIEDGKHFAVLSKMHHCMIDGGSGMNLMQLLLRTRPDRKIPASRPFEPRAAPSRAELAAYELGRRLRSPLRVLGGLRGFAARPSPLGALWERLGALGELLQNVLPASKTPISGVPIGPHRRVDWLEMPFDELTKLRRELGCTLNDLMLTIVTGAVQRYLGRRGVSLSGLDFRISIPVNVRRASDDRDSGNRVSTWIIPLPLDEPDPRAQLEAIQRRTRALKKSNQALGFELVMAAAEEMPALLSLWSWGVSGQVSMIVSNVPGPPIPLYMLGCRAVSMHPLPPLVPGVGLAVALLSYNGTLCWGFQADYDLVPDLSRFSDDVVDAHHALEALRAPADANAS